MKKKQKQKKNIKKMQKSIFLIFFWTFFSYTLFAITIPDTIITKCNTAKDVQILSHREKGVILYVNIARYYPKYFLDNILIPYMDSAKTNKKSMFYKTLLTDLNNAKSLNPLTFNAKLYPIAKKQARNMGWSGKVGHSSSRGKTFEERTVDFSRCGEDCSYGYRNDLDIVFQLMLDEGVPSLGHRKNILDPSYKTIAVSIYRHRKYKWNCVIDFAL